MALIGNQNIIKVHYQLDPDYYGRGASSSWTEFNTSFRMDVTPVRSDSVLLFNWNFTVQTQTHHSCHSWRLYNVTDSAYLDNNGNLSNRNWVHAQTRGQYNGDNAVGVNLTARYSPGSTSTKTYTLHYRNDGGDTYLGHSQPDGTGSVQWRHSSIFTVYELEDL